MEYVDFIINEVFDRNDAPKRLLTNAFKGYPINRWLYIKRAYDKYGEVWIISAVIHGSIGYHTYHSAKNLLQAVLAHQPYLCERTSAIFNCDASLELANDIYSFELITRKNLEKAKRTVEFTKKLENLTWEQAMTISMAFPTLNI